MTKKPTTLWEDVGLWLWNLFRSQWPHLYVSRTEHTKLKAEVIRLKSDKTNLQVRLQSEASIGLANQAQLHRDYAVMNRTIQTRAQELAEEMVRPLRRELAEVITERDLLRQESTHHGLTGLYNKAGLKQAFRLEVRRLAREWRNRNEANRPDIFLVAFDLDHFKEANDRLGHAGGDAVLQVIAELMRKHLGRRPSDLLCHPHGDEFVVVLPGATSAYVQEQAEAFLIAIRTDTRLDLRVNGLRITASIGVAVGSIDHTRPIADVEMGVFLQELLMKADAIMYEAKRAGRNAIALSEDITRWSGLG